MREYCSKGIICIDGPCKLPFLVCEIDYTLQENGVYRYTFIPNYSVISLLTSDYFQGIPGLNLDLKKKEYVRDNIIPTFISERVPSENREDYYEMLQKVNMDYMDPIEYLIRSNEQYSGDKLFVIPYKEKEIVNIDDNNSTNHALIKRILLSICSGDDIIINGQSINDSNRKTFYDIFIKLYSRSSSYKKESQQRGIENAKSAGLYKGRKPIYVDELKFRELLSKVEAGQMNSKDAAKELGISIDKYYRFKKKLQN